MIDRILIVGLGSIGKRHLRIARELLPHADIRVLRHQECTSTPEHANGCFSNLTEAISFAPQLAVIANPAQFHLSVAMVLAQAGVHLLIEKPISASVDGITKLLEISGAKETVILIGYNLRYVPSLQKFRGLIQNNKIGKLISVRCEVGQYLPSWRPGTDYRKSVSAQRELGGGVLLELSHELDYLRWIFGEINWAKATLAHQSNLDINVEDTAHLIFGFDLLDNGCQLIGTVNLDFVRHDSTRICTAIGEKGSLRWNGLSGAVELYEAGAKEWSEIFCQQHQRDVSYFDEWQHFLSCISSRVKPMVTVEDGLSVLLIIEACRLASESGKQVQVETIKKNARNPN
jgi:predicted dehydrogenase